MAPSRGGRRPLAAFIVLAVFAGALQCAQAQENAATAGTPLCSSGDDLYQTAFQSGQAVSSSVLTFRAGCNVLTHNYVCEPLVMDAAFEGALEGPSTWDTAFRLYQFSVEPGVTVTLRNLTLSRALVFTRANGNVQSASMQPALFHVRTGGKLVLQNVTMQTLCTTILYYAEVADGSSRTHIEMSPHVLYVPDFSMGAVTFSNVRLMCDPTAALPGVKNLTVHSAAMFKSFLSAANSLSLQANIFLAENFTLPQARPFDPDDGQPEVSLITQDTVIEGAGPGSGPYAGLPMTFIDANYTRAWMYVVPPAKLTLKNLLITRLEQKVWSLGVTEGVLAGGVPVFMVEAGTSMATSQQVATRFLTDVTLVLPQYEIASVAYWCIMLHMLAPEAARWADFIRGSFWQSECDVLDRSSVLLRRIRTTTSSYTRVLATSVEPSGVPPSRDDPLPAEALEYPHAAPPLAIVSSSLEFADALAPLTTADMLGTGNGGGRRLLQDSGISSSASGSARNNSTKLPLLLLINGTITLAPTTMRTPDGGPRVIRHSVVITSMHRGCSGNNTSGNSGAGARWNCVEAVLDAGRILDGLRIEGPNTTVILEGLTIRNASSALTMGLLTSNGLDTRSFFMFNRSASAPCVVYESVNVQLPGSTFSKFYHTLLSAPPRAAPGNIEVVSYNTSLIQVASFQLTGSRGTWVNFTLMPGEVYTPPDIFPGDGNGASPSQKYSVHSHRGQAAIIGAALGGGAALIVATVICVIVLRRQRVAGGVVDPATGKIITAPAVGGIASAGDDTGGAAIQMGVASGSTGASEGSVPARRLCPLQGARAATVFPSAGTTSPDEPTLSASSSSGGTTSAGMAVGMGAPRLPLLRRPSAAGQQAGEHGVGAAAAPAGAQGSPGSVPSRTEEDVPPDQRLPGSPASTSEAAAVLEDEEKPSIISGRLPTLPSLGDAPVTEPCRKRRAVNQLSDSYSLMQEAALQGSLEAVAGNSLRTSSAASGSAPGVSGIRSSGSACGLRRSNSGAGSLLLSLAAPPPALRAPGTVSPVGGRAPQSHDSVGEGSASAAVEMSAAPASALANMPRGRSERPIRVLSSRGQEVASAPRARLGPAAGPDRPRELSHPALVSGQTHGRGTATGLLDSDTSIMGTGMLTSKYGVAAAVAAAAAEAPAGEGSLATVYSARSMCEPASEVQRLMSELAAHGTDQLVILETIGQGGYGTVYRGIWRNLDVAVKTVLFQDRANPHPGTPMLPSPPVSGFVSPASGLTWAPTLSGASCSHGPSDGQGNSDRLPALKLAPAPVTAPSQADSPRSCHAVSPSASAPDAPMRQPSPDTAQQHPQPAAFGGGTSSSSPQPTPQVTVRLSVASQQRAVLEAAVSCSVTHPNVVATYHYDITPVRPASAVCSGGLHVAEAAARAAYGHGGGMGLGLGLGGGIRDWKLYLVQEFCDAGSLAHALDRRMLHDPNGMPNLAMVLCVLADVARGMAHIHARSIIHGDLNPTNILLRTASPVHGGLGSGSHPLPAGRMGQGTGRSSGYAINTLGASLGASGGGGGGGSANAGMASPLVAPLNADLGINLTAKISDFGLCNLLPPGKRHVSGALRGTPFYTAPETAATGTLTKASDVYSFGVLVWEVYTGQPPFRHSETTGFVRNEAFPRMPPHVPPTLAHMAAACLSPNVESRPSFEQALERLVSLQVKLAMSLQQRLSRLAASGGALTGGAAGGMGGSGGAVRSGGAGRAALMAAALSTSGNAAAAQAVVGEGLGAAHGMALGPGPASGGGAGAGGLALGGMGLGMGIGMGLGWGSAGVAGGVQTAESMFSLR